MSSELRGKLDLVDLVDKQRATGFLVASGTCHAEPRRAITGLCANQGQTSSFPTRFLQLTRSMARVCDWDRRRAWAESLLKCQFSLPIVCLFSDFCARPPPASVCGALRSRPAAKRSCDFLRQKTRFH